MFVRYIYVVFGTCFVNGFTFAETIQCYCNLPECASDNNICIVDGEDGGCFSDFLDYKDFSRARQGCLHLLPKSKQDLCGNAPGSTGAPRSLLLCCQVSMCNQLTHSIIGSFLNATERRSLYGIAEGGSGGSRDFSSQEVWFKAATIAVPICGVMILVMLVGLACKILRADNVTVDKFRRDASNAAAEMNQYTSVYVKDAAKTIPLLSDSRQNCEDFRSLTTTRIHYGQNVNVLKEKSERAEKNVEYYARVNADRLEPAPSHQTTAIVVEAESVEEVELDSNEDEEVEASVNDNLDVRVVAPPSRVVPSLSLNLEKVENVESCNLYQSPRVSDTSPVTETCTKVYEKNLL